MKSCRHKTLDCIFCSYLTYITAQIVHYRVFDKTTSYYIILYDKIFCIILSNCHYVTYCSCQIKLYQIISYYIKLYHRYSVSYHVTSCILYHIISKYMIPLDATSSGLGNYTYKGYWVSAYHLTNTHRKEGSMCTLADECGFSQIIESPIASQYTQWT